MFQTHWDFLWWLPVIWVRLINLLNGTNKCRLCVSVEQTLLPHTFPQGHFRGQSHALVLCLLITIWHMPYDALLRADSTISLKSLKTRTQHLHRNHIPMTNLPASAWYQWYKLNVKSIRFVSLNAGLIKTSPFILVWASQFFFFFFFTSRDAALCDLSQYGFDQMCDGSAALINLRHLFLVPVCRPLASWHPYEADRLTAT